MKWVDTGVVTSVKGFGEKDLIVTCLTKDHGLHKGLLKSSKNAPRAQPGALAYLTWSGRLQNHLGAWSLEPLFQPIAHLLSHPLQLAALSSACSLMEMIIPEREKAEGAYNLLVDYVKSSITQRWREAYLKFERGLLALMGFDLQLDVCAVTGLKEELLYISPKSGRAVSKIAGEPYKDRLFSFPLVFKEEIPSLSRMQEGLKMLGYFLEKFVLNPHGTCLPAARDRLLEAISRRAL